MVLRDVAAALQAVAGEGLVVPTAAEDVPGRHVPVNLGEVDVLVEGLVPRGGQRGQVIDGGSLQGGGCRSSRQGEASGQVKGDQVLLGVALAVVVEEEEELVLDDGAAHVTAELMIVISALGTAENLIDEV